MPSRVVAGLRPQPPSAESVTASSGVRLLTVAKKTLLKRNGGTLAASPPVLVCSGGHERFRWQRTMTPALVSELVAIIRAWPGDPEWPLAPVLGRALAGSGFAAVTAEIEELARRARALGATDEEVSLSVGAVLAMARARTGTP
jgi:hypothetical protein